MPTVLRLDGFRFVVWTDEPDEPPHVHAFLGGLEAKVAIGDATRRPAIVWTKGMADRDAVAAIRIVAEHQAALLGAYRRIHG